MRSRRCRRTPATERRDFAAVSPLRPGLDVASGRRGRLELGQGPNLTRTLAGLAAPLIISPVAGLRTRVPALRAGTLRRLTFSRPGKVNSPSPRGCTEPKKTFSKVEYTPAAVFRGISFSSAIRLISADSVMACLTGLTAGAAAFVVFLTTTVFAAGRLAKGAFLQIGLKCGAPPFAC